VQLVSPRAQTAIFISGHIKSGIKIMSMAATVQFSPQPLILAR
jgi:hypothetical protein